MRALFALTILLGLHAASAFAQASVPVTPATSAPCEPVTGTTTLTVSFNSQVKSFAAAKQKYDEALAFVDNAIKAMQLKKAKLSSTDYRVSTEEERYSEFRPLTLSGDLTYSVDSIDAANKLAQTLGDQETLKGISFYPSVDSHSYNNDECKP